MFQRVLVALDDTPLSEQLLRYAAAFAGAFQARVTLLRAYNRSERFAMLDTPPDVLGATAPLRQASADTPLLLLTGYPVDAAAATAAGIAAVDPKPFEVEALLTQVAMLLARTEPDRQVAG